MREVISVHVGQAGVQIGNACCMWFSSFYTLILSWLSSWHGKRTKKRVVSAVVKFIFKVA
jgi:hypothetical protein